MSNLEYLNLNNNPIGKETKKALRHVNSIRLQNYNNMKNEFFKATAENPKNASSISTIVNSQFYDKKNTNRMIVNYVKPIPFKYKI
jgi:hypothetical protein